MTETRTERKNRTNKQNKYLWAVPYRIIADALAERGIKTQRGRRITEDHVHYWCKTQFLRDCDEIVLPRSGAMELPGSTSCLTTAEFQDYVTKIQAHFAALQIDIPDPNEHEMTAAYGPKVKY